jgi:hypothetical protein
MTATDQVHAAFIELPTPMGNTEPEVVRPLPPIPKLFIPRGKPTPEDTIPWMWDKFVLEVDGSAGTGGFRRAALSDIPKAETLAG